MLSNPAGRGGVCKTTDVQFAKPPLLFTQHSTKSDLQLILYSKLNIGEKLRNEGKYTLGIFEYCIISLL